MIDDRVRREWREGGLVVLSGTLGMALATVHIYSLGIFMEPLEQAFAWSRSEIAAGSVIVSVFFIFASPIVGRLVDRSSPRSVAIPGIILYCVAFAILGATGPSIWSWWFGWLLLAVGTSCISATVWTLGAARRFDLSRGLALAVVLTGTGLSSAFVPVIASTLIEQIGWRSAFTLMGGVGLIIVLPIAALFFRDAPRPRSPMLSGQERPASGYLISASLASPRFWIIGLCALFVTVGCLALIVHFVPILTSHGISRQTAVWVAGLIGILSVAGRLVTGIMLDRFHGRFVAAVAFVLPAAACALLLDSDMHVATAALTAAIVGVSLGAEIDVIAYLTSRYFGLRNYGVLFGVMNILLKVGAGLGPFLAAVVYDRTGSYEPMMIGLVGCFLLSAISALMLGPYPSFQGQAGLVGESSTPVGGRSA